jgi:hypothetical protein
MAQIEKILEMMRREPGNVSFNDFKKVCVLLRQAKARRNQPRHFQDTLARRSTR